MILEGIVTTVDSSGVLNVAPMGPRLEPDLTRFVLRPFRTSTTYRNLKERGEGVFHVTDDVLLFARSILGLATDVPARAAERVTGKVLLSACHYVEFRATEDPEGGDRARFCAEAVHSGRLRDFLGFNRAKHAVIETAILASRADFLPADELLGDLPRFQTLVDKTGGEAEREAFRLLKGHIRSALDRRDLPRDPEP